MIKFSGNTINDWYCGASNLIKVYRNGAVVYQKIGDGSSGQTPCFAVVDDISQYQDRTYEDVYNSADSSWYKLNNLNAYEKYGVYGSGRTITYYDGKLTIDNNHEYIYSGGSWNDLGEVSGNTATLPDVPFTINYNAKNYDPQTQTLVKTSGQLADVDAVITEGTPTPGDGYLTIHGNTRAVISGYEQYFNRNYNSPNITIVSKQLTESTLCHLLSNRDSIHNWMYRPYYNHLTLHGGAERGQLAVTTQPVIESARVSGNAISNYVVYDNYTDKTSSSIFYFAYGSENNGDAALFAGYANGGSEWFMGDFYWIYMSQNTLTDEQIQQVIAYNEGGSGETVYPEYYEEIQDPPNNVVFTSMTEAESYECPWVGMHATIASDNYVFNSNYEWEQVTPPTKDYLRIKTTNSGTLTFTPKTGVSSSNTISYSFDSGSTWTKSNSIIHGDNEVIYLKGESLTISNNGIGTFSSTSNFDVEGNVMSLLYGDNFENEDDLTSKDKAFMNLFSGCTTVINASGMTLPATTLSKQCYCNMFNRAVNLTTPPSLSAATTLAQGCCQNMFYNTPNNSSFVTNESYVLPASTLVSDCYRQMFYGCSNISKITCLATSGVGSNNSTLDWLQNTQNNGIFTKKSNVSWSSGTSGTNGWLVVDT